MMHTVHTFIVFTDNLVKDIVIVLSELTLSFL